MQFKSITAITVLLLVVVSLSVAGCTSSSNTATPTPLAADNLAGAINDLYKKANYTLTTPFTMTKQGDKITYHGVIVSAPIPAKSHAIGTYVATDPAIPSITENVTIVFATSGGTAASVYANTASTFKTKYSPDRILSDYGYGGRRYDAQLTTDYRVYDFSPTQEGAVVWAELKDVYSPDTWLYLPNADMRDYYEVLSFEGL